MWFGVYHSRRCLFSLDLDDFEEKIRADSYREQLDMTFAFAEKFGVVVSFGKFQKDIKGEGWSRRPVPKKGDLRSVSKECFTQIGDEGEQFPTIVLGKCEKLKGYYLVCVDLDCKKGKDGIAWIDENYPEIRRTNTIVEKTASGGEHWYFLTKKPLVTRGVFKKHGVDLLGYQKNSGRHIFVPPALGKCLEKRHAWVGDIREQKIAELPPSFEALWGGAEEKKETEKKAVEELDDFYLIWKTIPRAIERHTDRKGESLGEEDKKLLSGFLDALGGSDSSSEWEEGKIDRQAAYLSMKMKIPKEFEKEVEDRELFLRFVSYFPGYDEDICGEQFDMLAGSKPRVGGGLLNKIKESKLIKDELSLEIKEKLGGIEELLKEQQDAIENDEEYEEKTPVELWILSNTPERLQELEDDFRKELERTKDDNLLAKTTLFIHGLSKNSSLASSFFSAVFIFSVLLQNSYAIDSSSEGQPPIRLNQYMLILAEQAWGKGVFSGVITDFLNCFFAHPLTKVVSAKGFAEEVATQIRQPFRGGFINLREGKTFFKDYITKTEKYGNKLQEQIKEALNDVYTDYSTAGNRKGGSDGKIPIVRGVQFSAFGTTTYDYESANDEILSYLDKNSGSMSRTLINIEPRKLKSVEKKAKIKTIQNSGGSEEKRKTQDIVFEFVQNNVVALNKRIHQNNSESIYKRAVTMMPAGVNDDGVPFHEALALEWDEMSQKEINKNQDIKKKKEVYEEKLTQARGAVDAFSGYMDGSGNKISGVGTDLYIDDSDDTIVDIVTRMCNIFEADDSLFFTRRSRVHLLKFAALFGICSKDFNHSTIHTFRERIELKPVRLIELIPKKTKILK